MKKILILLALCIPISSCMITGINDLYRIIPVENQSYEIVSYFEKKKKIFPQNLLLYREGYIINILIEDSIDNSIAMPITFHIEDRILCMNNLKINIGPHGGSSPLNLAYYMDGIYLQKSSLEYGYDTFVFGDSTYFYKKDGSYGMIFDQREITFDIINCETKQKVGTEVFRYVPKKIGWYFVVDAL
ncbi:hypothetical protein RFH42_09175 [Acinetobacter rudis]|uniref:hypothetical protein n=1 Tax=Acinetobacter rudis TaxID=632955 RepID=UPI00280E3971|nr:hypothetical protein [Acinetobacter rudis]MDQ8953130.1 hypothetical protein [Acinetobacter rudis]